MKPFHFRPTHPHHYHINLLLIISILLIGFLLVLVKPALLGYKISKQVEEIGLTPSEFLKSIEAVKSKLLVAETNLETCKGLNTDLVEDISVEKNTSFKCSQEKNALESQYKFDMSRIQSDYENRRNEIEAELNRNNLVVNTTLDDYSKLLENSANNLCCKARVDDKRIDSYIVSNNVIVCTAGEEKKVSC